MFIKSFKFGFWKLLMLCLGDGFFFIFVVGGDVELVMCMKLYFLELEYKFFIFCIVYVSDFCWVDLKLLLSVEKLVGMWLVMNLIDEVYYYWGKDFVKCCVLKELVLLRDKWMRVLLGNVGMNYFYGLLF